MEKNTDSQIEGSYIHLQLSLTVGVVHNLQHIKVYLSTVNAEKNIVCAIFIPHTKHFFCSYVWYYIYIMLCSVISHCLLTRTQVSGDVFPIPVEVTKPLDL